MTGADAIVTVLLLISAIAAIGLGSIIIYLLTAEEKKMKISEMADRINLVKKYKRPLTEAEECKLIQRLIPIIAGDRLELRGTSLLPMENFEAEDRKELWN